MPDLILRLRVDPVTGKREIVVDYTSEADALPVEHEDEHRRLAGKVVEGGLANDKLSVTREGETPAATETPPGQEPAPVATPIPTRK